jgi:hypothetical protein
MDKGKVNIVPPSRQAKWFHLIGVPIGNASEKYTHGDEVQVVETWTLPDVMGGITDAQMEIILAKIDKGMGDGSARYSSSSKATTRGAWKVVMEVEPKMSEKQAREIINTWVKNGVLVSNETRRRTRLRVGSGGAEDGKIWGFGYVR